MSPTAHRIRRQQWRVKAPSGEAAFAIRQRLRSRMESELLPAMARAFDVPGVGDDVVRIPRLELDLRLREGECAPETIAQVLSERLVEALRGWAAAHPPELRADRQSPAASRRQLLLGYLDRGRVEWHAGGQPPDALAQALREEARLLAAEPGAIRELLRGAAAQLFAACFRLLALLPAEAREALLGRARLPDMPAARRAIASALRELAAPGRLAGYSLLRAQALLLAAHSATVSGAVEREFLELLRETLAQAPPSPAVDAFRAAAQDTSAGPVPSPAVPAVPSAPPEAPALNVIAPAQPDFSPRGGADADPADGFPAHDAGLVLLHPYLERLFDATGIAPAGARCIPEACLPRAAALLHWLLAGRDEIHEFELATIKILLGADPGTTLLVAPGLLPAADREEADALLAAAISHWAILGATRIDGLRRTFLQRRGELRDLGHAWSLRVEPAAFDVLLASLPWSVNLVKLPWMTRPIFIEWPTP